MSRVVNTNSPGKRRSQHMRSSAELLRHLSQKAGFDDESKDMFAAIAFELRGIQDTIDEAVEAWEKRDYWIKAEHFRNDWSWVNSGLAALSAMLKAGAWNDAPSVMMQLFPNFSSITVNKFTRSSDLWDGKYEDFLAED